MLPQHEISGAEHQLFGTWQCRLRDGHTTGRWQVGMLLCTATMQ
jgi:hypothetical protein